MTKPTDLDQPIDRELFARAFYLIAMLLNLGKVDWVNTWSADTIGSHPVLHVDVTGKPADRDLLLQAINAGDPESWSGEHGTWRDWRGHLFSTRVLLTEAIPPAEPLDDAILADAEPQEDFGPAPASAVPALLPAMRAAAAVNFTRGARNGRNDFHAQTEDAIVGPRGKTIDLPYAGGPHPDLQLLVDAPTLVQVVPGDRPGRSAGDLLERYAGVPGVAVVSADDPAHDPGVQSAWSNYARARAILELGKRKYPTMPDAVAAINAWPGRDMLEDSDVQPVADALCAQHRGGKLLAFLPAFARRTLAGAR